MCDVEQELLPEALWAINFGSSVVIALDLGAEGAGFDNPPEQKTKKPSSAIGNMPKFLLNIDYHQNLKT